MIGRIRTELTHDNTIKVFETFSGIGTQVMALHRLKHWGKNKYNIEITNQNNHLMVEQLW